MNVEIPLKLGLSGEFRIKKHAANGEVLEERKIKNIITDTGLDLLSGSTGQFIYLYPALGVGTSVPSAGDTSLSGAEIFSSRLTWTTVPATTPPYVSQSVGTSQSTQGQVAGTWTEIGLYTHPTMGSLFSRALILDDQGDPTSITVLPTEFLTVTYTLNCVIPDTDVVTVNNGRTYTTRAANANSVNWCPAASNNGVNTFNGMSFRAYSGNLASITGSPSGALSGIVQANANPYVPGSFESIASATFPIGSANGTINSFMIFTGWSAGSSPNYQPFQVGVSPAIVKDNTQTLTVTFKVSWGRAI